MSENPSPINDPITTASAPEPSTLVCVNHPNRATSLRCNRCNDPICPDCAILTPTGYRCKKCVRGQQKTFETAEWYDYPVAIFLSGAISLLGSLFVTRLGFFSLLLAPVVGMVISEVVRWAVRRRRGKWLFIGATAASVLGALPIILMIFLSGNLLRLLFPAISVFLIASTLYYRLSGISIRR